MCIPSIFYVFSGCDTVPNFYSKKNVKYGMFGCKIFPTLMRYSFVIEIDQVMSQKQTWRSLKTSFWRCSKCIYIIYISYVYHIYIIHIYIYIIYISVSLYFNVWLQLQILWIIKSLICFNSDKVIVFLWNSHLLSCAICYDTFHIKN